MAGITLDLKYKNIKLYRSKKILIGLAVIFSGSANSEVVIEHSGSVTAGTAYHSNIQFLPTNADSIQLYTVRPTYRIKALDGVNEWTGEVGVQFQRSSNKEISEDREDPFGTISWLRELERGTFGLTAQYVKQTTRLLQFTETGLVAQDGTAVTRSVTADWTTQLSDRFELISQAAYEKTNFANTDIFSANSVLFFSGELGYKMNEKFTPFVILDATDFKAFDRIKFQNFFVGGTYSTTPQFQIRAGAGLLHVSSSGQDEGVGFFEVSYEKQRSLFNLIVERTAFATDTSFVNISDNLIATYNYELSDRSAVGANVAFGQNLLNQETQSITSFYARELTPSWAMRLDASLANIKRGNSSSANNNSVGISFTYNSPKF